MIVFAMLGNQEVKNVQLTNLNVQESLAV